MQFLKAKKGVCDNCNDFTVDDISLEPLIVSILTDLSIEGPKSCAENSHAQYRAIAHYENNSTRDVTTLAEWSVEQLSTIMT